MTKKLVIQTPEPAIVQALREDAAANGRSVEAEFSEILRNALCRPPHSTFKEILAGMSDVGTDEDFEVRYV